ncbi:unnamed protein product, partial [Scytosiphon promiscuus]
MVDVCSRQCSYESCRKRPTFNIAGSMTASYCKQHAGDGMVDVRSKRCSHDACSRIPLWGVLSVGSGSVCADHKGDLPTGQVINFRVKCKVVGCSKMSRWGIAGEQPTRCPEH